MVEPTHLKHVLVKYRQIRSFPQVGLFFVGFSGEIILPTQTSCIVTSEIPQNCHRFVLFDSPPNRSHLMTPLCLVSDLTSVFFFWSGSMIWYHIRLVLENKPFLFGNGWTCGDFCMDFFMSWRRYPTDSLRHVLVEVSHEKNPYYFPLYWLVNRDPYNGLWNNPYIPG